MKKALKAREIKKKKEIEQQQKMIQRQMIEMVSINRPRGEENEEMGSSQRGERSSSEVSGPEDGV